MANFFVALGALLTIATGVSSWMGGEGCVGTS